MTTQEVTTTTCPQCRTQYTAPITPLIDVTGTPQLKQAFMQGQLNLGQCPGCGTVHPLDVPILYHDAEKELALIFVPNSMGIAHDDEQRMIGKLTTKLMNSLPPEQRKGYLLIPRTFISMENLLKEILIADGITEEMLQAQESKIKLIDQMLKTRDETAVTQIIQDNRDQIDYQFFEILTSLALQAFQAGDDTSGQTLLGFRQFVAATVGHGNDDIAAIDEQIGLQALSPTNLLDSLRKAKDDNEFTALIMSGKPLLTYEFFQTLTQQIETAVNENNPAEAEALKTLRTRILETSSKLDEEARQTIDAAQKLLQDVFSADDPQAFIKANLERFDETFLSILVANIQGAEKAGDKNVVAQLANLYQLVMTELQSQLPPEMQLINQLIGAQQPAAIQQLLAENSSLVTPKLLQLVEALKTDVIARGEGAIIPILDEIKRQIETTLNGGGTPASGKILIAR